MGQNFLNKPFPVSFLWTETHLQLDLDSEEICSGREKEPSKYGVMIFLFKELKSHSPDFFSLLGLVNVFSLH